MNNMVYLYLLGKENNDINWDDKVFGYVMVRSTWYELERVQKNMGPTCDFYDHILAALLLFHLL